MEEEEEEEDEKEERISIYLNNYKLQL